MARDAIALTGPTCAGKTALALVAAELLDAEIICMDSRQIYRGMDIGTAKVTAAQQSRVRHHGIDLLDPHERYSAGRFASDARSLIGQIRGRDRVPMLVGGSGFFLRALIHPLFREPAMPEAQRERLKRYLARQPAGQLSRWLGVLDPVGARHAKESGYGPQRLGRALEVVLLSGRPLSWWHAHSPDDERPLSILNFVLAPHRETLYERINARVHEMIAQGLIEEVANLLAAGYDVTDPGMNATGYREITSYLRKELSLADAVAAIQQATRKYARRQLTWFRHQLPEDAIWLDAARPAEQLAERMVEKWLGQNVV